MPVHDWTRVDAGVFHHFHHSWIEEIQRALNSGPLPGEYYAMAEQHTAGYGPDVLTLELAGDNDDRGNGESGGHDSAGNATGGGRDLLLAPPKVKLTAETDLEFYRRRQKVVAVRHVTGDRIVAIIEIVSPGNRSGRKAINDFVVKAGKLLARDIHLLIVDVHPPGPRDPQGIHDLIWEEVAGQNYAQPFGKPLTLASYECDLALRTYVRCIAVGDRLEDMPPFLDRGLHVEVPLEQTQSAFAVLPKRWQRVIEPAT